MTSTTFFIIFIPILSFILLFVNLLLAPHNPYQEKDSVFECGFHSFLGQNRTQFSVSFFIFGLLFLLFDLEILLVYPYSVSGYNNDIYGLAVMMIFFVLLTLGFIFELGKNALTIDSKQTLTYHSKEAPGSKIFLGEPSPVALLESGPGFFLGMKSFYLRIKGVTSILFSRRYITYLLSKLFTKKTLCIVVSSIVIGNVVRYFAIKYGVNTPLLLHPVLFSSATGISSFLSIASKITIEMIFNIFDNKQFAMIVDEHPVVFNTNELDINFKSDNNNDGLGSSAPKTNLDTTFSQNKVEEVSLPPLDFSKLDNLLNELKGNINTINQERLKIIKKEIKVQIDLLQGLSSEAQQQHIPNYLNLIANFRSLREFREFNDVKPVVDSLFEIMRNDLHAPDKDLLESNPEKF